MKKKLAVEDLSKLKQQSIDNFSVVVPQPDIILSMSLQHLLIPN
jgi:ABC-type uncharacterized transport system ATPase subunit